ncbi:MAG: alpha/beta hydrolase, partial [Cyanobacteriota bacterium]|nr:alpha/beta hydrolase [Cyanobacteriota bacterium]
MDLNTITISAETDSPEGLIVFLHGWGANAEDLASLTPLLRLPQYQFIFPDAPFPHPQVPLGRAWYSLETPEYKGLEESRQTLQDWLTSLQTSTGIPASRTILGGFSQGGAMTMDVGRGLGLAALVVLSGYLHFTPEPVNDALPPMLIVHGRMDRV